VFTVTDLTQEDAQFGSNKTMLVTLEPGYEIWSGVIQGNQGLQAALDGALGAQLRREIRGEVLGEAARHTNNLSGLAKDLGISFECPEVGGAVRSEGPVIMSGHQPILFHMGLFFKSKMLAAIAGDTGGTGVHVVVDTDEGDGGTIVWPKVTKDVLEIKRTSLVAESLPAGTIYGAQRLAPAQQIAELFEEIESDIRQSNLPEVAERVKRARSVYTALANQPVSVAHTIARWSVSACRHLEVLLSDLIMKTRLGEVVRQLVGNGVHFAQVYNATLDEHRLEHRIDNKANPFPNLKVNDAGYELPLWAIEQGVRKPVYVNDRGMASGVKDDLYAPRGSITTLLLRGYCSDTFIHGLGGKRYDTFVDRFAQRYWGVALPKFVVASETRYLFPEQVAHISREVELASQFKEIVARTENYLGRGIFSEEEERALRLALESRQQLRGRMQGIKSDEERRPLALALNEANRQVRQIVEASALQSFREREAANKFALEKWKFREFPFFMFGL
jgi:hypothetical protein